MAVPGSKEFIEAAIAKQKQGTWGKSGNQEAYARQVYTDEQTGTEGGRWEIALRDAVSGLQSAGPGSSTTTKKTSSSKPKAPATKAAPKPATPQPTAPAPVMPLPAAGSPVPAGAGGGGAAPATGDASGGEGGLSSMLASISGPQQTPVPFTPQLGPGLRAGLGQRAYPVRNLALAGLRTIY